MLLTTAQHKAGTYAHTHTHNISAHISATATHMLITLPLAHANRLSLFKLKHGLLLHSDTTTHTFWSRRLYLHRGKGAGIRGTQWQMGDLAFCEPRGAPHNFRLGGGGCKMRYIATHSLLSAQYNCMYHCLCICLYSFQGCFYHIALCPTRPGGSICQTTLWNMCFLRSLGLI